MAWKLLFGSDIGLFSVFTIVATIVIAFFYINYFIKKANDDK